MSEQTDVLERVEVDLFTIPPKMYKVILHNDDRTTFEFVMVILQQIFHKSLEEAAHITLTIHENGKAVVAIYTKEIAEEKVHEVTSIARSYGYPLQIDCEPE
jgi:ATP-dependent Clp protease adaptor protein ClpS